MKILITGGAGFIGINSAARFLERGWTVIILDNFSRFGAAENVAWLRMRGSVEVIESDVRDRESVKRTVRTHRDAAAVLHLAAQVAVTTSISDPLTDCEINTLGTLNLLEAVRQVGADPAFIYASTNKVYGDLTDLAVRDTGRRYAFHDHLWGIAEDRPVDFRSPYGCSKGAADMYVLDYARTHGLRTVSLRQSCVYGPRQFGMADQGWVAWFVICAMLGRPITIFGDGKQVRDVLFIDDLIDCYERCIEEVDQIRGKALNIGGGPTRSLSLLDLIAMLENEFRLKVEYAFTNARPGDQRVYVSDIRRASEVLGWQPTVSVQGGTRALVEWVADNRRLLETVLV